MKWFLFCFLFFIFAFLACNIEPLEKPESRLIEYPAPFYFRTDAGKPNVFYGVETNKFIYVRDSKSAWLLYDKRIETSQLINLVGLDEYIFIQSDLETQLRYLLEIRKYNQRFINLKGSPWKL